MAITDERTPRLNLPLPFKTNALKDDVERLREAFGSLDGTVATVDGSGKIPLDQLPSVALAATYPVDSQAAMLALNAQPGSLAIRSDVSKTFVLMSLPASTLANWKEMLNDALIQLSRPDGIKNIGRCTSVANLRATEPTISGQAIILEKVGVGCPVINEILYHDPYDTTSPDDGVSVWVTPGGARWKANIGFGYNLFLAGLKSDGSNFSTVANAVVSAIVDKIVANGRVNNVMRLIVVPAIGGINTFTITAPVKWPTVVHFLFFGSVYFEASGLTNDNPFYYQNSAFIGRLTSDMFKEQTSWPSGPKNQATGRCGMTAIGGEINIRGPGYALDTNGLPTIKTYGIVFGNDVACDMDVRDVYLENLNIIGFYGSHKWGMFNTFMCGFKDSNFSRCYVGMETTTDFSNAGERMWYSNCTFGNIKLHGFLMNGTGDFTLENVSCDFMGGDLFHFGPLSPGEFKYISGHIEGIDGYISYKETPASYSKSTVYIGEAVKRDPRRGTANYRGIAKDHACPSSSFGQMLTVTDASYMPGREGTKPNTPYPTVAGEPANTGVNLVTPRAINAGTPWPNSYSPACSNRVNAVIGFTEISTGDVGGNLLSTDYAFAAIKTGNAKCEYGTAADLPAGGGDGYMPFKITLTDPSESVQLFCTNEAKAESGLQQLWGSASINIGNATGTVLVSVLMASYLRNSISTNSTFNSTNNTVTSTSTSTPIQRGISASATVDMTAQKAGTGLTNTDYQAMYPRSVTGYYQGNDFFLPGLKFTGFVGTIYVKLPIWWFVK